MATDILYRRLLFVPVLSTLLASLFAVPAPAAEPHWIRVSSAHFSVLTDADPKYGREAAVRFEQMRSVFGQLLMRSRVNLSEPLDLIAVRSDDEYFKVAPIVQGRPIGSVGFFVAGSDRNYMVLDVSQGESWRAVSYDFARLLLEYNYPPTPRWFDEGFSEYFSSLKLGGGAQIGGEPTLSAAHSKSFVELLNAQTWQPVTELFAAQSTSGNREGTRDTLFAAQSWIVMHYLINKNRLEETGNYFELVESQKLPVAEAIQKAYGMTSAQFEQAVKDYFVSLAPLFAAQKQPSKGNPGGPSLGQLSPPAADEQVGSSTQQVADADGQALLAEMSVRLPERRDQAVKDLESIASQPKADSVIVHRALAWAHMQKNEFEPALEELGKAAEFDPKDSWLRYYLALVKYHMAQASGQQFQGLANMMQDLKVVLDWDPEFAEAYNMLGMARVEGGGINSAMEAERAAIRLSPRNETYLLNMAQIYLAGKNWDAATAMLERLKTSQDPQIASAASKSMADLPTLKKYGMLPQREPTPQPPTTAPAPMATKPAQPPSSVPKPTPQPASDEIEVRSEQPPEPQIDRRPIRFLKGRLISVDCSQAPAAVLTVSVGAKAMKLRTEDYKLLTLIGADQFSCAWTSRAVAVNYKAGGKADGDLVSVEVQ